MRQSFGVAMDIDSIRPLLSGLAGALIVGWLARRASQSRPAVHGNNLVLRYPKSWAYVGMIMGGVFLAFAVRNAIYGSAVNSYAVALSVPLILGLLGFYLAAEALFSQVTLTTDRVRVSSPWRTHETTWQDITRISYNAAAGAYVLHTKAGGRLRVSRMLTGIDALVERAAELGIEYPRVQ
jgi:hypothetical protein